MGEEQPRLEQKEALRSRMRARRAALSAEQRARWSADICRRVTALPEFQRARRVLLYAALPTEVDLSALPALAPGKDCFYPRCLPHHQMEALRPLDESGWTVGAFGIREPAPAHAERCRPEVLELVLVPLVAFDAACSRLGMGGGYYDRFLSRCTGATAVGVAFSCQRAERLRPEPWDWPLDAVVTERSVYRRRS